MTTKITKIVTIAGIVIGLFGAMYLILATLPKTRGRDDKECSIASTGGCAILIEENTKQWQELEAQQKILNYENNVYRTIATPPSFQ